MIAEESEADLSQTPIEKRYLTLTFASAISAVLC